MWQVKLGLNLTLGLEIQKKNEKWQWKFELNPLYPLILNLFLKHIGKSLFGHFKKNLR
jgi:hypothetical protein